jgi:hypothetical protein
MMRFRQKTVPVTLLHSQEYAAVVLTVAKAIAIFSTQHSVEENFFIPHLSVQSRQVRIRITLLTIHILISWVMQ